MCVCVFLFCFSICAPIRFVCFVVLVGLAWARKGTTEQSRRAMNTVLNQIKALKSVQTQLKSPSMPSSIDTAESSLLKPNLSTLATYGTTRDASKDEDNDEEMQPMNRIDSFTSVEVRIEMDKTAPLMIDFVIAVGYIILGVVAMTLGLGSLVQQ